MQSVAGALTTMAWDYENRNAVMVQPSARPLTNLYDATGLRRFDGTNSYIWDGQNTLQQRAPLAGNNKNFQYTNYPGYWGGLSSQQNVSGANSYFYAFDPDVR